MNDKTRRVFVFEYLSGGGPLEGDGDGKAAAELLPVGCAMRDALVEDLLQVEGCQVTAAACAQAPLQHAEARRTQAPVGESMLDWVARQATAHDVAWIVAPETGGLLARLCLQTDAARWLGCEHAAIAIASSKRATLARLAAFDIATPLACADWPDTTRWVVKPDDGAGSVDTRTHLGRDAAERDLAARTGSPCTLEPWVEGEPLSLSLLCAAGSTELLSVNRQHIELVPDGCVAYRGVALGACSLRSERGTALRQLARHVARAIPGLRGYVGIDLVWHATRGPVVIEVNPRVTCAYAGLSASLGRNLAGELLAAHEIEHAHAAA